MFTPSHLTRKFVAIAAAAVVLAIAHAMSPDADAPADKAVSDFSASGGVVPDAAPAQAAQPEDVYAGVPGPRPENPAAQ